LGSSAKLGPGNKEREEGISLTYRASRPFPSVREKTTNLEGGRGKGDKKDGNVKKRRALSDH